MAQKHYELPFKPESVSIQGYRGSFSNAAADSLFPGVDVKENTTFREAFEALERGDVPLAVIPIYNTTSGVVPYVPQLIREMGFHAVGEVIIPIEMCFVAIEGAQFSDIQRVHSHQHALEQCVTFMSRNPEYRAVANADTALAAKMVAELSHPTEAAISSPFAAQLYGLSILQRNIQSRKKNKTRFLVLAREGYAYTHVKNELTLMTVRPRYKSALSLAKILLAFETHRVPCVGLEQFTTGSDFAVDGYFLEVLAHRDEANFKHAMREIEPLLEDKQFHGCFPRYPARMAGRSRHV